eukprot:7690575-Pyramimonas_sp.AAC.1
MMTTSRGSTRTSRSTAMLSFFRLRCTPARSTRRSSPASGAFASRSVFTSAHPAPLDHQGCRRGKRTCLVAHPLCSGPFCCYQMVVSFGLQLQGLGSR